MKTLNCAAAIFSLTLIAAEPTTTPVAAPATRPAAGGSPSPTSMPSAPRPMPRDYAVLEMRSIFYKGRGLLNSAGGPTTGPDSAIAKNNSLGTEDTLVFDGVTETDVGLVAFVENTAAHKVETIQVGQPLAAGQVTDITLHTLDYWANGKTVHVEIGHNLHGTLVESTTQPTTSPTTAPAGEDDILERLRKRRLQEIGGK